MLIVPYKEFATKQVLAILWEANWQPVLLLSIAEVRVKMSTDFEPVVGGNCNIASVKQDMKVASEKHAIIYPMLTSIRIRADIRGLENWKNLLIGHSTLTLVSH